jgi:hypothetical protein
MRRWRRAPGRSTTLRATIAIHPAPLVPAVSRGFAAFEQRDFATVIVALEPLVGELERIGGSRAQLDLVVFTLVRAYLSADRPDDARRMLSGRRRGRSDVPVAGLAAVH